MLKRVLKLTVAAAAALLLLSLLTGCSGVSRKQVLSDLRADGSVVTAVAASAASDHISLDGLELTKVKILSHTDDGDTMSIKLMLTVANEYISCNAGGTAVYVKPGGGNPRLSSITLDAAEEWKYIPLRALIAETVANGDLPYSESIIYDEFTVGKASFNKRKLTSSVEVNVKADNIFVIAEGKVKINYSFTDGKWTRTGFTRSRSFKLSWDIGGRWECEKYKWNSESDWELQYVFDIHSINSKATVKATVYDLIFSNGKQIQSKKYDVTGKIDPETMTLTLDFGDGKQIIANMKTSGFSGKIINTTDDFVYYRGAFTRQ